MAAVVCKYPSLLVLDVDVKRQVTLERYVTEVTILFVNRHPYNLKHKIVTACPVVGGGRVAERIYPHECIVI